MPRFLSTDRTLYASSAARWCPSFDTADRDCLSRSARGRRRQRNAQRFDAVADGHGRFPIGEYILCKVLELKRVGALEALHEVRHGVVGDAVLRHQQNGRLAEIADPHSSFGAEQLSRDVIAVEPIPGQVDYTQPAAAEDQRRDCVIDITDRRQLRVRERRRRSPKRLRHPP